MARSRRKRHANRPHAILATCKPRHTRTLRGVPNLGRGAHDLRHFIAGGSSCRLSDAWSPQRRRDGSAESARVARGLAIAGRRHGTRRRLRRHSRNVRRGDFACRTVIRGLSGQPRLVLGMAWGMIWQTARREEWMSESPPGVQAVAPSEPIKRPRTLQVGLGLLAVAVVCALDRLRLAARFPRLPP